LEVIGSISDEVNLLLSSGHVKFYQSRSLFNNPLGLSLGRFPAFSKRIEHGDQVLIHGFYNLLLLRIIFLRRVQSVFIMPHGSLEPYQQTFSRYRKSLFHNVFRMLGRSKAITFLITHQSEANGIQALFPDAKVRETGLGVDIPSDLFVSHRPMDGELWNLVTISRIAAKKRIDLCIRVIPLLKSMGLRVRLSIIGEGEPRLVQSLVELSKTLDLYEVEVFFLGYLSKEEISKVFETAHILLLPSENENFAISVAEAIAHACPVVVSAQVALSEFVEKNDCGFVITFPDELLLKDGITNVMDNWDRYSNACHESRGQLDWNIVALGVSRILRLD